MSPTSTDSVARRNSLEQQLAVELRELNRLLTASEATEAGLVAAIGNAQAMQVDLAGPTRARWFETVREHRPEPDQHRRESGVENNFSQFGLYRGTSCPIAPPMQTQRVTMSDGRAAIEARVTCNELYEGPPHGVHGGYVAGLFDDALGGTVGLVEGPSAVTGTLTVRYRKLTPLHTELRLVAWVESVNGRRIHSRATCHAGDLLTAEAEAMFVRVDMAALADRSGLASPPNRERSTAGGQHDEAGTV